MLISMHDAKSCESSGKQKKKQLSGITYSFLIFGPLENGQSQGIKQNTNSNNYYYNHFYL